LITAASLNSYTVKDLVQLAKKTGVQGWNGMRKDQLVRALVRAAKAKTIDDGRNGRSASGKRPAPVRRAAELKPSSTRSRQDGGRSSVRKTLPKKPGTPPQITDPEVAERIQKAHAARDRRKDLAQDDRGPYSPTKRRVKDRIVLMVRDPYWLHAYWELSRKSVERAQAAMAEHWHTARPTLRLYEVASGTTTSSAERVVRDIPIHGGVRNWYIDVADPPKSHRVDVGYLAASGKFYSLARSNVVSTPSPGNGDAIDENWLDVAEDCERIFALSGGYGADGSTGELQELFEERLRRPMGSPMVTRYGMGAEIMLNKERNFRIELNADMVIYGTCPADSYVTLGGEPVKLRPDGSFSARVSLPDRRQVLPLVAASSDGVEQRTIVIAVERNTKVLEPVVRDPHE
jgi:hypothetical protein